MMTKRKVKKDLLALYLWMGGMVVRGLRLA